jgi:hypothetical protein
MTNHLTIWQPIPAARPRKGIRAPDGYARRFRTLAGVRRVDGSGRGAVIPMGILLKEGET